MYKYMEYLQSKKFFKNFIAIIVELKNWDHNTERWIFLVFLLLYRMITNVGLIIQVNPSVI